MGYDGSARLLLTWFGSVVVFNCEVGQFGQRRMGEFGPTTARVLCVGEDSRFSLRTGQMETTKVSLRLESEPDLPLGIVELVETDQPNVVHLRHGDVFAAAHPNGSIGWSPQASIWEKFLLIDQQSFEVLIAITNGSWVARSRRQHLPRERIHIREGYKLWLGDSTYQIGHNLPLRLDEMPRRSVTLYSDVWKVEQFVAFDPVIYFVALGAHMIFDALAASLRSIEAFGSYSGRILVMSERSTNDLLPYVPPSLRQRLTVVSIQDGDWLHQCLQRYRIGSLQSASTAQPLIYLDTDVVVDAPLNPFLVDVLLSDHVQAGAETDSPLGERDSVGATLFRQDGTPVSDIHGFNSGLLGMPSVPILMLPFRMIEEVIERYVKASSGRRSLSHFDQAVANYVTNKLDYVRYDAFSSKVRWSVRDVLCGGSHPCGFVHFWGSGHDLRPKLMNEYLSSLMPQEGRLASPLSPAIEDAEDATLPMIEDTSDEPADGPGEAIGSPDDAADQSLASEEKPKLAFWRRS